MGMFDTVHIAFACPYCGVEREREVQTKCFRNVLDHFRAGSSPTLWNSEVLQAKDVVMRGIGQCDCKESREVSENCYNCGQKAESSRQICFDVGIHIVDGVIVEAVPQTRVQ